jgi:ABC-type antimicrobial peptide transport system permease subunit
VGVVIGGAFLQVASLASSDEFPIDADPQLILTTGAAVVALALLASIGSLRRVAKVSATDVVNRQSLGGTS